MVPTVRCYDDYFLIISMFSSRFEYIDMQLTFCQISRESNNRKDNFEGSPRNFGTDLVVVIAVAEAAVAVVKVVVVEVAVVAAVVVVVVLIVVAEIIAPLLYQYLFF